MVAMNEDRFLERIRKLALDATIKAEDERGWGARRRREVMFRYALSEIHTLVTHRQLDKALGLVVQHRTEDDELPDE